MSLNIKIEPFEESSSIVDLSSDEDDLVSEKIEIPEIRHPAERPGTPDTHCSICLEELTNKCHSDSCWHLFCFECLKRWSTIESSCPLCKKIFKTIHHTLADPGIHETYEVPIQERELSPRIFLRPFGDISDVNRIFRMNLFLDIVRRNERLMSSLNTSSASIHDPDQAVNLHTTAQLVTLNPRGFDIINPFGGRRQSYGQAMRIRVYNENVWAEPLPDLSGRYRDCNSAFYRNNPAQTYRLHGFILRDVTAIRSLQRSADEIRSSDFNEEVITGLVMRSVSIYEIRDPIMTGVLRPYLGEHTAHFCHELYNYANSPYDMIGYDRNVRYSSRQDYSSFYQQPATHDLEVNGEIPTAIPIPVTFNHSETIILDSDEDEELVATSNRRFTQEIIVLSSSSEDSDVEILGHSFRPIEVFDSSRDQPSTSTGIRDSLDRSNNRYNLRRRRLFSPIESSGCPVQLSQMTYSPSLRRERVILDSTSSDEESITSTRDTQAVHMKSGVVCGRRKKKIKKNKHKKRKRNTDDSRPEIRVGSRSRSYSGSSSSGDTDSRPNNNCMAVQTNVVM